MTVGGALQYRLAERGATAARSSSARPRSAATSRTPGCGSSTAPSSPRAPTSSSSRAHDDFDYAELRTAVQAVAARRRARRRRARPQLPDARRPVAGHRRRCVAALEYATSGDRRRRWASPSPTSSTPRSTASARAARWWSAIAWTRPRGRARGREPRRARSSSPGRRPRGAGRARRTRLPRSQSADTLAELVLARPDAPRTHHKHSSSKGYRRLLDSLAAHPPSIASPRVA